MKTNPLGSGTKNVTANIELDDYIGFAKLVSASGISMSKYCGALIRYAVLHHLIAGEDSVSRAEWLAALKAGTTPQPTVRHEIIAGAPQRKPQPDKKNIPSNVSYLPSDPHGENLSPESLGRVAEDPILPKPMKKKRTG